MAANNARARDVQLLGLTVSLATNAHTYKFYTHTHTDPPIHKRMQKRSVAEYGLQGRRKREKIVCEIINSREARNSLLMRKFIPRLNMKFLRDLNTNRENFFFRRTTEKRDARTFSKLHLRLRYPSYNCSSS